MDEMGLDELDDIEDDIDEEEERLFEEYRYHCVDLFFFYVLLPTFCSLNQSNALVPLE